MKLRVFVLLWSWLVTTHIAKFPNSPVPNSLSTADTKPSTGHDPEKVPSAVQHNELFP